VNSLRKTGSGVGRPSIPTELKAVKIANRRRIIHRTGSLSFPLWSIVRRVSRKQSKGRSPKPPAKILVVWETVPDPDPEALMKAVRMLFRRPAEKDRDDSEVEPFESGKQQQLPF